MSTTSRINSTTRRLISVLIMVAILAIFLGIYFLKYVPDQKQEYNRRAFRELQGVAGAFTARLDAWQDMRKIDAGRIALIYHSGAWAFYDSGESAKTDTLSIREILDSLTAGDNDVFDSYVAILPDNNGIAFSGTLSLGNTFGDTGSKKASGFEFADIRDVKVEGNDYKFFLYRFGHFNHNLILGGLLSLRSYTQRYTAVPADFVTTGAILFILLIVAIPFLKIYIIGSHERITNFDLRMIIGSYYVGSFILFFLIIWAFLEGSQTARNKKYLNYISSQLETKFKEEIDSACRQLKRDEKLYRDSSDLRECLQLPNCQSSVLAAMYPNIYRRLGDVFWIDNTGKWVARYFFKPYITIDTGKRFNDRQYFQDLIAGKLLNIGDSANGFCLQPTLGRLDGSFVVNIVIPTDTTGISGKSAAVMMGMASHMYSVCNTILPPGYGFSIIDGRGTIFFDSRDRSLLNNISNDLPDTQAIWNCIRYRQQRFFASTPFHGMNVALQATPMDKLPYTALVYYDLERDQQFQLHVLGTSCFVIGCVLLLLIFSAYCNEWSRSRFGLSSIPVVNFEWLRPTPAKTGYYRHLMKGMAGLAACYCLPWVLFQTMDGQFGAYLFLISILFPFYLALHYALLKEKLKQPLSTMPKTALAGATGIPALVILTVMAFLLQGETPLLNKILVILTQIAFILVIRRSLLRLKMNTHTAARGKTPGTFAQLIVAAILLTVIVPAAGIFCFFYKEETTSRLKTEKLIMSADIDDRAGMIATEQASYFLRHDSNYNHFLRELQFSHGIYLPDSTPPEEGGALLHPTAMHPPDIFYAFHNLLFPGDYKIHAKDDTVETAADRSWFFQRNSDTEVLVRTGSWSNLSDGFRLPLAPMTRQSALGLLYSNSLSMGPTRIFFFILIMTISIGALYWLTTSLATRVFLLRIFSRFPAGAGSGDFLAGTRPDNGPAAELMQEMAAAGFSQWTADDLRKFEDLNPDYNPLYVELKARAIYSRIWDDLDPREKFVLYDFALDSLANYKAGTPLFSVIEKGILRLGKGSQLHFATHSFHNFVLDQSGSQVIIDELKTARDQGSWQNFKTPLLVILASVGMFVFFTQNDVYQKITGLITSLGSILPILTQIFNKGNK